MVNRGQCTRPTFLAGHYNARFTGVGLVCVCSCTQGCAAVHVRALHRKIPGVRIKFSPLCVFLARSKETERFREIVILFISASLYSLYSLSLSPILTYKRGFSQGQEERLRLHVNHEEEIGFERAIVDALTIHTRHRWVLFEIPAACHAYASIKNSCTSLTLLPYIPA